MTKHMKRRHRQRGGQIEAIRTLAGGTSGSANGIGTAAQFRDPWGIVTDSFGNVYVAEYGNHCIRKIDPSGSVTTFAGVPGSSGTQDGERTSARFNQPHSLAINSSNTLFVVDSGNHTLRMITPYGQVSTIAGSAGSSGTTNGEGTSARFNQPYGIALDASGDIYIADTNNHIIRKYSSGNVTTFAGSGSTGMNNGTGTAATFYNPYALAIDTTTNTMYVADWGNGAIRKINLANANVRTLAGNGSQGFQDGISTAAQLRPANIALSDMLYVADADNNRIRSVNTQTGEVKTIAGSGVAGNSNSTPLLSATFNNPRGIWIKNHNMYVTHFSGDHSIRIIFRTTPYPGTSVQAAIAPSSGTLGTATYPGYSDKAILGNKAIYTKTLPFVGQCGSYPIFEEPSTILLMAGPGHNAYGYVISNEEATSWIGMQLYNADGVFLGNIVSTFRSEYCSMSYPAVRTRLDSVRGPLNSPFTIRNYDTNTYPGYSDKAIKAPSVGGYRRRKNKKTRRRPYKIENKTRKN